MGRARLVVRLSTAASHSRGPVIVGGTFAAGRSATTLAHIAWPLYVRASAHGMTGPLFWCAQLSLPGGSLSAKTKEALTKARTGVELLWE